MRKLKFMGTIGGNNSVVEMVGSQPLYQLPTSMPTIELLDGLPPVLGCIISNGGGFIFLVEKKDIDKDVKVLRVEPSRGFAIEKDKDMYINKIYQFIDRDNNVIVDDIMDYRLLDENDSHYFFKITSIEEVIMIKISKSDYKATEICSDMYDKIYPQYSNGRYLADGRYIVCANYAKDNRVSIATILDTETDKFYPTIDFVQSTSMYCPELGLKFESSGSKHNDLITPSKYDLNDIQDEQLKAVMKEAEEILRDDVSVNISNSCDHGYILFAYGSERTIISNGTIKEYFDPHVEVDWIDENDRIVIYNYNKPGITVMDIKENKIRTLRGEVVEKLIGNYDSPYGYTIELGGHRYFYDAVTDEFHWVNDGDLISVEESYCENTLTHDKMSVVAFVNHGDQKWAYIMRQNKPMIPIRMERYVIQNAPINELYVGAAVLDGIIFTVTSYENSELHNDVNVYKFHQQLGFSIGYDKYKSMNMLQTVIYTAMRVHARSQFSNCARYHGKQTLISGYTYDELDGFDEGPFDTELIYDRDGEFKHVRLSTKSKTKTIG